MPGRAVKYKMLEAVTKFFPSRQKCGDCESLETGECLTPDVMKLSAYRPGQKGKIVQICGNPDMRLRLMEMGFVKGTVVQVVKFAPLTDPMELVLKGYHVTLRRSEAADILMNRPEKAA